MVPWARGMEDRSVSVLRITNTVLVAAIHQAFVESRFATPHGVRYVNVHADGTMVVSRNGLSVSQSGSSIIALECFGVPEFPDHTVPMGGSWTREEYLGWVSSRRDLYLEPALDELRHQAKRQGLQVELMDPDQ